MSQDSDVARVMAALRTQGIRYLSFGNKPVRKVPAPQDEAGVTASAGAGIAVRESPQPPVAGPTRDATPRPDIPLDHEIVNQPEVDKFPLPAAHVEAFSVRQPALVEGSAAVLRQRSFAHGAGPAGIGQVAGMPAPLGQGEALLSRLKEAGPALMPMPSLLAQMAGPAAPMPGIPPLLNGFLSPAPPMAPAQATAMPPDVPPVPVREAAPLAAVLRGLGQGVPPAPVQAPAGVPQSSVLRSLRLHGDR